MTKAIAIVGGGLAGFVARVTLIHGALDPDRIVVFEPAGTDPAGSWRRRAESIRQRRMRSESDGHCLPASFPGLAVRAAVRRRNPWPLVQSVCDRFHPTVDEFLDQLEELRARSGWDDAVVAARIHRIHTVEGGFELDGHGVFRHVLLAPGHPGLNVPEELAGDPRAVHVYEPHGYSSRVAVVGAGMAAATEWQNALAAGSSVVSVRRREPLRRPLNVPRPLFTKRGLAAFHRTPANARLELLADLGRPSYPPGRRWDGPLERAVREGRFSVAAEVNGAEQVICATGFLRGWRHDPLLRQLVEEHGLETAGDLVFLDADSTVPALTDRNRTLALAGIQARWAFPAADTLAGMKYAARRFLRRVGSCRTR